MELIKDTVKNIIESLEKIKKDNPQSNPQVVLKKILTKKELRHIKFNYFRKGIFGIKVDSSAWLYYLNLHKEGLLNKLSRVYPEIREIRFSLGEMDG
jgi:hypothetical protein